MPIMEISVVPLGSETLSLSEYVADSIKVLKQNKSVTYQLTSMGTIVEADTVEELFDAASAMHNAVFSDKIQRVVTTIKIDDRRDKRLSMDGKVKSVNQKLSDLK